MFVRFLIVVLSAAVSYTYSHFTRPVVVSEPRAMVTPIETGTIRLEVSPSLDALLQRNAPPEELATALTRYYEGQRGTRPVRRRAHTRPEHPTMSRI